MSDRLAVCTRARLVAARELASIAGTRVAPWMLWRGWRLHVGCARCTDHGETAGCWGVEGCHGYDDDCGCLSCAERQDTEERTAVQGDAFAQIVAAIEREPLVPPLSLELGFVSRQLARTEL